MNRSKTMFGYAGMCFPGPPAKRPASAADGVNLSGATKAQRSLNMVASTLIQPIAMESVRVVGASQRYRKLRAP